MEPYFSQNYKYHLFDSRTDEEDQLNSLIIPAGGIPGDSIQVT